MKKQVVLIVVMGVLSLLGTATLQAGVIDLLTNGNFEQSPFGLGWGGIRSDSQYKPGLNNSENAMFIKGYGSGGWVDQSFDGSKNEWKLDVSFLTERTGSSPFSGFRFMLQYNNGNVNNASQIYLITQWSGSNASISVYNSSNGLFETLIPNVVKSSYDYNGDGDYEDLKDIKVVYHLSLNGHYNEMLDKAFYDIKLYDDNGILKGQSLNVDFFNRGNPTTYVPNYIMFPTSFAESSFTPSVFDDISFTTIPEPATLLLLGFGAVILRKRIGFLPAQE